MPASRHMQRAQHRFLLSIVLVAVFLLTIATLGVLVLGMLSRLAAAQEWRTLDKAAQHTEPQRYEIEGNNVYLIWRENQPIALDARDTYSHCLVAWVPSEQRFIDPCNGTRYLPDGAYQSGPAPRGLDSHPIAILDQKIWANLNALIPGAPHP